MHQCLRCSVKLVLVPLLLAGVADGVTPVMGAAASAQAAGAAVPVTTRARLDGVAATSATNAWAVGGTSTGTLAER
jgi:hypothetical protein